jgi:hypothetical protein
MVIVQDWKKFYKTKKDVKTSKKNRKGVEK